MLKESQGNGMAKIKTLRHHLLVMATCLAMMLASTCFAASATDEDVSANGAANNEAISTGIEPERRCYRKSSRCELG